MTPLEKSQFEEFCKVILYNRLILAMRPWWTYLRNDAESREWLREVMEYATAKLQQELDTNYFNAVVSIADPRPADDLYEAVTADIYLCIDVIHDIHISIDFAPNKKAA